MVLPVCIETKVLYATFLSNDHHVMERERSIYYCRSSCPRGLIRYCRQGREHISIEGGYIPVKGGYLLSLTLGRGEEIEEGSIDYDGSNVLT